MKNTLSCRNRAIKFAKKMTGKYSGKIYKAGSKALKNYPAILNRGLVGQKIYKQ